MWPEGVKPKSLTHPIIHHHFFLDGKKCLDVTFCNDKIKILLNQFIFQILLQGMLVLLNTQ